MGNIWNDLDKKYQKNISKHTSTKVVKRSINAIRKAAAKELGIKYVPVEK